ncbi:ANTAR domain-containing protein [Mycobacterium intracellulare]|uniref:ANTAR domain-containing protein n=2 Tax=Mycobacterium intracellulare TaxID=1767 RepID=A0A7U5MLE2_MYCIT|nr:ANTAR domain-containing protein [Mycobacterium intracellulare]ASL15591.1 sensor histidine kinase [Mycobacterium intracellulare subsp. chimaera]ASQ86776.1 histidine kinase [Mycobacterium intracellulare subsp. chimaera]MCF1812734.1 ANTAR domain-containing protein [Mycobacterium intracellulare subsp. intracellulare]MDM3926831.1 ANTAR domain-containing protein [Mycobacterium intracellulare subsp. chimaera]MDS0334260.1 ANTAR domain-containing protein [Mycobacterium intracellulare]
MRNQGQFDAIAREMVQGVSGVCCVLLDRDLRIRAASRAYEQATLREHNELPGKYLFEAFPDNPKDPQSDGTSKLASSLEVAMSSGHTHKMRLQRYDIPDPAAPEEFLPKVWSPVNSSLLDHGELVGVVHCVKEVSESRQLLAEVARDVEHGDAWDPAELLHTFEAVSAVEAGLHAQRQESLALENKQLMRAIETRDVIGQAKGVLMERFNIDAGGAFGLLTRLSQQTNTRVEQIARTLVETKRPPRSA